MKQYEYDEVTAIRGGYSYTIQDTVPTSGVWWAVKLVPTSFPSDDFHPITRDGADVIQACVIACQRRTDNGLWQWCHLTMAAKRIWGDLIYDNGGTMDIWYYVVEAVALAAEGEAK